MDSTSWAKMEGKKKDLQIQSESEVINPTKSPQGWEKWL